MGLARRPLVRIYSGGPGPWSIPGARGSPGRGPWLAPVRGIAREAHRATWGLYGPGPVRRVRPSPDRSGDARAPRRNRPSPGARGRVLLLSLMRAPGVLVCARAFWFRPGGVARITGGSAGCSRSRSGRSGCRAGSSYQGSIRWARRVWTGIVRVRWPGPGPIGVVGGRAEPTDQHVQSAGRACPGFVA